MNLKRQIDQFEITYKLVAGDYCNNFRNLMNRIKFDKLNYFAHIENGRNRPMFPFTSFSY